jgi:glycosyltransferase involved in cell wall biosynthesis
MKSDRKKLCVVAPAYNEGDGLNNFFESLKSVLETIENRYDWTLIIVIDPSEDNTVEVARDLALSDYRVSALVMSRRVGHQVSLMAGMDQCRADACITMDADLQHPPELIPQMLSLFETGADVVQTVRLSTDGAGTVKAGLSKVFYKLINRASEVELIESGADFRLLSKQVLTLFQTELRERNPFLRGLVQWTGFPTVTLAFVAPERQTGKSKYSVAMRGRLAMSGVVSFSKTPLKIGLLAGASIAVLAFIIGIVSIVPIVLGESIPPGWTTLAVLMAFLSSAQLLTIGLLGVYVGAIFDEVKQRPHYIIRERIGSSAVI